MVHVRPDMLLLQVHWCVCQCQCVSVRPMYAWEGCGGHSQLVFSKAVVFADCP